MYEIANYQRKLFIVYNRAMSKARKTNNDPKLIQRLHKAFSILQTYDYYQEEKALYQPTPTSCGCEDWKWHFAKKRQYKLHCKHMISEILLERMQQIKYKQTNFLSLVQ